MMQKHSTINTEKQIRVLGDDELKLVSGGATYTLSQDAWAQVGTNSPFAAWFNVPADVLADYRNMLLKVGQAFMKLTGH